MKIGILLTCYNCESYVDRCIEPWMNLKDKYNFIFSCNSGMFRDYFDLGIQENNQSTLEKLISHKLDFLVTTSGRNLLDEDSSRNLCLDFLKKQDCDLLVYLDGDEIYTEEQIISILNFIEKNPEYDQYSICFKNYTIEEGLFLDNFNRKSIYWMKRYGGINRFYFDSDFIYNDPASVYTNTIIIPREIAFVEHYSWISSDPRTKIKIGYQNKRYIGPNGDFPVQARCSFSWDEEKNKLIFNPSFWSFYNMQIPVLKKEMEVYTFELKVDFNREENRIDIINHSLEGNHLFLIKDFNGAEYGSYEIYLSKGISYWINPTGDLNLDKTPLCEGISVEIFRGEEKLHHERFYLKIK